MKKILIAFAAAALVAAGLTAFAWQDQSAQDAADYAATHPVVTGCQGGGR